MWGAGGQPLLVYLPLTVRKALWEGMSTEGRHPPSRSSGLGEGSGMMKSLQEACFYALETVQSLLPQTQFSGCGFQNLGSSLPSLDEANPEEPVAALSPASEAKVSALLPGDSTITPQSLRCLIARICSTC